jgi:hypothetical protein
MEASPSRFVSLPAGEITRYVDRFESKTSPESRYASFDYCYNYFRTVKNVESDIEKSCFVLGFYLASWGMMRGSSFLLQKSAKHLKPVVKYIATLGRDTWEIDVDSYSEQNIEVILAVYRNVKECLVPDGRQDVVLTTKVILGVFGFIPAFDKYFTTTFRDLFGEQCRFRKVNKNSLTLIREFYQMNQEEIDHNSNRILTFDFGSGEKTKLKYPKAKIIDMYGFEAGLDHARIER